MGSGLVREGEDDKMRRLLTAKEGTRLPRRFYKEVSVGEVGGARQILLDGRAVKTPLKAPLALPCEALAAAVAQEWQAQGERIDPGLMPCTKLSNTAIDRVAGRRDEVIAEIMEFAGNDLICYRAGGPQGLVERQCEVWDPLLAWMARRFGTRFVAVTGLVHEPQPAPTMKAVRAYLEQCGAYTLTGLHNLTTLTGSCVLAMALREHVLGGDEGWSAAHVDEDWQIEHWGRDGDAELRRAQYKREYDATLAFIELAGDC